ncbi:hypothetical protein [Mycoplasma procyoni]|uniref:hypothetical protein n=1 Tax=Mycoplasma procyoni TaxID=568784 RepID=UPI00197BDAEF|nr:hypothetical protein [Mycoplasma procyoni]MBN3534697.1 hypothetical protein [Mycoplasma procyoni]
MDKKTQKKQYFLDFVVYRIFSSKYHKDFVLEGSKSIDIKARNQGIVYYILPKDLDLNLKFIESKTKEIEQILHDIFAKDKEILIELNEDNFETENKFFFKIKKLNDRKVISNLEVDIIIDFDKYKIEDENFEFEGENIKIQTYNIEKYIANKILSLRKVTKVNKHLITENSNLDLFRSDDEIKILIDIIWFTKTFQYNDKEVLRNLELMFDQSLFNKNLKQYLSYFVEYFYSKDIHSSIERKIEKSQLNINSFDYNKYLSSVFEGILKEQNEKTT